MKAATKELEATSKKVPDISLRKQLLSKKNIENNPLQDCKTVRAQASFIKSIHKVPNVSPSGHIPDRQFFF